MRRPLDHRRKRKTAPAGNRGGLQINSDSKIEYSNYSGLTCPAATPASDLITVHEACRRSGENPAAIIRWIIRHKIGGHVKTGKAGNGGDWMVDPDRLQELLEEQREPAP